MSIVCVHIGGCGNALGERFYDSICHEHGLTPSGFFIGNSPVQLQKLGTFFTLGNRVYAKAVLADTEDVRASANLCCTPYAEMFAPFNLVSGQGIGTGNNFAKAYHTDGKDILYPTLDAIRGEVERSDMVDGFQLCHSIGGGTGSGFTSLLLEHLANEYTAQVKCSYAVIPSHKVSHAVVENYNAMLCFSHLLAHTHLTFMIDNEAIYEISKKLMFSGVAPCGLQDMNSVIGQTMAGITSGIRFPGQLNTCFRKIYTNMCPYPDQHLLVPGFAPIIPCQVKPFVRITANELVYQIFNSNNFLSTLDFKVGKILTLAAIFRGRFSPREIDESMRRARMKNSYAFCNWIPNGIKWSICDIAPVLLPKSVSVICNSSGIQISLQRIADKAMSMFKKRAYVHLFVGEGMEEDELRQAHEKLVSIVEDYKETAEASSRVNSTDSNRSE